MGILDTILNPTPTQANDVGIGMDAGGQILGGLSHLQYGIQASQAAAFQAAQLFNKANNAAGAGQRAAYNAQLQTDQLASRALAVAAGSGGGASDPTVINTIARIQSEGAYRQAVALYQGQSNADELRLQGQATTYQGKETLANSAQVGAAQIARSGATIERGQALDDSLNSRARGNRTLIGSTGSSLFSRFAGDGPDLSNS